MAQPAGRGQRPARRNGLTSPDPVRTGYGPRRPPRLRPLARNPGHAAEQASGRTPTPGFTPENSSGRNRAGNELPELAGGSRLSGSIEFVGNCAIADDLQGRRIQYPDRLFCCRLHDSRNAQFIELAFAGPELRKQIEAASRSAAGHQRISISDLRQFNVALPSADEQQEIVRRTSEALSAADSLLTRIDNASRAVERSSQAILAKAFRGELISSQEAPLSA